MSFYARSPVTTFIANTDTDGDKYLGCLMVSSFSGSLLINCTLFTGCTLWNLLPGYFFSPERLGLFSFLPVAFLLTSKLLAMLTQTLNPAPRAGHTDVFKDIEADLLRFRKGQIIYMEGSTPIGLYVVKSGRIKITRLSSYGKEQIIRVAGKGEWISSTDLILESRYTTSAKSMEDSVLLFVPKHDFWNLLAENANHVCSTFLFLVSRELRRAESKITGLAYKPVRERLAEALIELSDGAEKEIPSVSISRNDLACYIGTAKETANRIISSLREEGLISTEGTRIYLLKPEALKVISRF